MNPPAPSQARLVIVGATGMVGGYALRYALNYPAIGLVTAIGRRSLGIWHPKLKEVLHQDFADCSALADALAGQDAAVFSLLAAGFSRLYIFRPAYIYPVEPRKEPNFSYRVLRSIYPVFRKLFPNQVIRADDLAHAMVDVVVRGTDKPESRILENRDIRAIVKSYHSSAY